MIAFCGFFYGVSYEKYVVSLGKGSKADQVQFASCQQGVQGNILNNFPAESVLVNVGRFCLFLALFCTYPLLIHPCRASLHR